MVELRSAGIDLSADLKKTGVAILEWSGATATVTTLRVGGRSDADLCDVVGEVDKTGIDCPLGWPTDFVDYVMAHQAGGHDLVVPESRQFLLRRKTDLHVGQETGVWGLSVSADRLGATAMRCAAILSMLTRHGIQIDRTGKTGPVVEVYPAASLASWELPHQGYKGQKAANAARRRLLVDQLEDAMPWLRLGEHKDMCVALDDALDAVICGVVAGLSHSSGFEIPEDCLESAKVEGWIALPLTSRQLLYERWRQTAGNTSHATLAEANAATDARELRLLQTQLKFMIEDGDMSRRAIAQNPPVERVISAMVASAKIPLETAALQRTRRVLQKECTFDEAYSGLDAQTLLQELTALEAASAEVANAIDAEFGFA